ncbi:ATP-binding protein [Hymenobacter arizonensis]|uniref:histidine kinase n=1 Tax=Hymenobacter arizonensis TaxID=1227077 RepID=A0A1I6B6Z7_HYMAR|nr:ATP-binding protein [Hymenobacter arizonensis]SFQ76712.1 Histidine kinase-, DNA gyrase B-, and HSP90-like ATPase [Hymenobacter arizonensis]
MILPIYDQKSRLKILIAVLALLIGAATVVYTNLLVQRVSEREQQQIQLYAKAQEFIINSEQDSNTLFVFSEIVDANATIPVILSSDGNDVLAAKNVKIPARTSPEDSVERLHDELQRMKQQHQPIVVKFGAGQVNYIYYRDSQLLQQLRTYPLVQLIVIGCLGIIAYFAFSSSRRAEQNRVWVGLAKETAHQLGTPLSSLVGWQNYLRDSDRFKDEPIVEELGKDIRRLEIITERFSNIGSVPVLKDENLYHTTRNAIEYLQSRVSKKVVFRIESDLPMDTPARINVPLFDWVIENICKNAVDAMDGRGSITLHLRRVRTRRTWYRRGAPARQVAVDITDTGKGIPSNKLESVFMPGFTTKKRGWGLGLALAKRIIENYHGGRLFVKWSEMGRGTTFRVVLNQ